MADKRLADLVIENAELLFRNFSGVEKPPYNKKGMRNFCVIIDDPAQAQALAEDSWNVKILAPRDEEEVPRHYIQVAVQFENYPPNIFMVRGPNVPPLRMDEEMVDSLDFAELRNIDIVLNPYSWEFNGKTGVKAYLKTMYVSVVKDQFAEKYGNQDYQSPGDPEMPF